MVTHNGHRSRNAWNVALWIGNDEGLYRLAMDCLRGNPSLETATRNMLVCLPDKTPDGARYNKTCVREALAGLRD